MLYYVQNDAKLFSNMINRSPEFFKLINIITPAIFAIIVVKHFKLLSQIIRIPKMPTRSLRHLVELRVTAGVVRTFQISMTPNNVKFFRAAGGASSVSIVDLLTSELKPQIGHQNPIFHNIINRCASLTRRCQSPVIVLRPAQATIQLLLISLITKSP